MGNRWTLRRINIMKKTLLIILLISFQSFSQGKFLTKTGILNFEASVPSFEEVAATNNSVTAILNTENGEFAALALVKGFRFQNALMEEHFNENYAESSKFPKATFKGNLVDFSLSEIENETQIKIEGELSFHGETKKIENVAATIQKEGSTITLKGNFKVLASDFKIKIPKIVKNKLSNEVLVSFDLKLIQN
jgi:polyisoprenoid-binding protein YceI